MNTLEAGAALPATERALVGLCHGLNDQLAALNAYVFLLDRKGALEENAASLQLHLDRLADKVRLLRALARDPSPEITPVAVSLLVEAATSVMDGYPEGSVVYESVTEEGAVVRCDWSRGLRALVVAGAWVTRGMPSGRRVTVTVAEDGGLRARAEGEAPEDEEGSSAPATPVGDYPVEPTAPRSARIPLG